MRSFAGVSERRLGFSEDERDVLGPRSVFYYPVEHSGNEQSSLEEALVVRDIVERLEGHTDRSEIVIVTPYRAQENLIRATIGEGCRVGTVDRLQGQQGDVVIYSLGSSSADEMPRDIGFLFSVNRLNVAMSRGRKKAILVCSPRLLEASTSSAEQMELVSALCMLKYFAEEDVW